MTIPIILTALFLVMTIVGMVLMKIDKNRAIKGKWRISEAALFLVAIFMGGLGTTIGMWAFRHKTKHWYFVVFMPIFAVVNMAIVIGSWVLM